MSEFVVFKDQEVRVHMDQFSSMYTMVTMWIKLKITFKFILYIPLLLQLWKSNWLGTIVAQLFISLVDLEYVQIQTSQKANKPERCKAEY